MAAEKDLEPKPAPVQQRPQMPAEMVHKIIRAEGSPPAKPLQERWFQPLEQVQNRWSVICQADVTVHDLLKPDYWSGVAGRSLRKFDKVIVRSEDWMLYVELLVVACGQTWAQMKVIGDPIIIPRSVAGQSAATDYEVVDGGIIKKWCIVQKSDGRHIKDGLVSPEAAWGWLREHMAVNGRAA